MKNSKLLFACCIALVAVLSIVFILGSVPQASITADLEDTLKEATILSVSQSCVVDQDGNLDDNCLEKYYDALQNTFSEDSKMIDSNVELMKADYDNFNDQTDVVLDNNIIDFSVQTYEENEDTATVTYNVTSIQKYIPFDENTGKYSAVLAASDKTISCDLVKDENGAWKVDSYDLVSKEFGTPQDLNLTDKDYQKDFDTRQEACQYASTIDLNEFKK